MAPARRWWNLSGRLGELRLLVHPVAARHGERMLDEGEPVDPLRLLRAEVFLTGVVRLIRVPAEAPGTQAYDDVTEHLPGAARH